MPPKRTPLVIRVADPAPGASTIVVGPALDLAGQLSLRNPPTAVVRTEQGREIILVWWSRSSAFYAVDRNCYHVGYPMDSGDIEDIALGVRSTSCRGGNSGRDDHAETTRLQHAEEGKEEEEAGPAAAAQLAICITCPLHQRKFDLSTGRMLAIDSNRTAQDPNPACLQIRTCLIDVKQRVHRVKLARAPSAFKHSNAAKQQPEVEGLEEVDSVTQAAVGAALQQALLVGKTTDTKQEECTQQEGSVVSHSSSVSLGALDEYFVVIMDSWLDDAGGFRKGASGVQVPGSKELDSDHANGFVTEEWS